MKFTDKDLLKAMGLKVGDKVLLKNYLGLNDILREVLPKGKGAFPNSISIEGDRATDGGGILSSYIGQEFEKVEQKIWTRDIYKLGEDKAYFVDNTGSVTWCRVHGRGNYKVLDSYIFFTKRKYAEEYLEELKKFNEEYKRNN